MFASLIGAETAAVLIGRNEDLCAAANVRFWHKADITTVVIYVRFRGVKRTLCGRAAMSAFDPKRTSGAIFGLFPSSGLNRYDMSVLSSGSEQ